MHRYEEKNQMTYITSVERLEIEKSRQQGLEQGLERGRQEGVLQKKSGSNFWYFKSAFWKRTRRTG